MAEINMQTDTGTNPIAGQYNEIIKTIRKNLPDTVGIYLFGSEASGNQHLGSNINLAIPPKHELSETQVWNLAQVLAASLFREVDLLDLKQASTVMRMQVISTEKRLYCSDMETCETFEDFIYSDYAGLKAFFRSDPSALCFPAPCRQTSASAWRSLPPIP